MDFTPLTVLVTGSSGFIGQHVVRHLHRAGNRVVALDFSAPRIALPAGVEFLLCDIRHGMLPARRFDVLVHLAAIAGVRPSLANPLAYLETNVRGTVRLLEWCRQMSTPYCIFASSSSVYGPHTPLPAEESATPDPCSPYALTKLHAEHWGRLYAKLHGLRFLALRFFSVWGTGQRPDLAMETFRRRLAEGKPLIINGDGSQRRDLTHVEDVARAVELALRWPGPGAAVLNVGTGKNHSVMDMLGAVCAEAAASRKTDSSFTDFTPRIDHHPAHPADVPETRASLVAVRKTLYWHPRIFFPNTTPADVKKV